MQLYLSFAERIYASLLIKYRNAYVAGFAINSPVIEDVPRQLT